MNIQIAAEDENQQLDGRLVALITSDDIYEEKQKQQSKRELEDLEQNTKSIIGDLKIQSGSAKDSVV